MRGKPEDRDDEHFWPFDTETSAGDQGPGWRASPPAGAPRGALPARRPADPPRRQPGESVLPTPKRRAGTERRAGSGTRPRKGPTGALGRIRRSQKRRSDPAVGPSEGLRKIFGRSERPRLRLSVADLGLLALAAVVLVLVALAVS